MSTAETLLAWYDRHRRDLPWRAKPGETANPYRVWLSEIMLQQTTVQAVKPYFEAFTQRWPNIAALAAAPEGEVMAAWAGLGYYSRARNLIACARAVKDRYDGAFPADEAALLKLPGIGAYTAAAITAIAFGKRAVVVDGNVERVVTRLNRIEQPLPAARAEIRRRADAITPEKRPGDFAQAMMDLGATICTPKKPACVICPLSAGCAGRKAGDAERFPLKTAKPERPARAGAAFVATHQGEVLLIRRPPSGLLGGMTGFPGTDWIAGDEPPDEPDGAPFSANWRRSGVVRHVFTHFALELTVFTAELREKPKAQGYWALLSTLDGEALPTVFRKVAEVALTPPAPPSMASGKRRSA